MSTPLIPGPNSEYEDADVPDLGATLGQWSVPGAEPASYEDGADSPRDAPLALDEYGVTGAEEAVGEPLAGRLARELPDVFAVLDGRDVVDGVDIGRVWSFRDDAGFPGRLVSEDEGTHRPVEPDAVAHVVLDDDGGFSAEEAAMHLVPETEF